MKVLGLENVAGTGIRVLDCALSVSEIKGLPAVPEDVCSVREQLQKVQQENGAPLRYLLRVNLQAGPVALSEGVLSNFALGLYHWLSPAPMGTILQLSAETLTALFAMMQRAQGPHPLGIALGRKSSRCERPWVPPTPLISCRILPAVVI